MTKTLDTLYMKRKESLRRKRNKIENSKLENDLSFQNFSYSPDLSLSRNYSMKRNKTDGNLIHHSAIS